MGSMGSMGSMRAYNLQMSQAMNRGVNGVNTGMSGMFGGAMGGTAQNMAAQNGLGNFKLEAGGGVSEFSNASSLTQQGSMGAGDGPSIRGVKPDPDAFIDAGGGPTAERAVAGPRATPDGYPDWIWRSSPPARRPGGCPRRPAEDVRRGAAGDGAMRAGAMQAGAMQGAGGVVGGRKIPRAEFPTSRRRRRRRRRRARLLRAETGARRLTDRRGRASQAARGADSSDARAGGGAAAGAATTAATVETRVGRKGSTAAVARRAEPPDHDASPSQRPSPRSRRTSWTRLRTRRTRRC